jgi:predicted lipoprotein with Yx(FWY)xxD motif
MKNLVLLKERRAGRLAASTIAVAGAIGLAAAGCGGGGQDQSGAAAGGSSASLVSVGSVDGSDVLVDAEGATLYSAEVEKGGDILCVDTCTSFWEPLTGSTADINTASTALQDQLGVANRPDGQSQLTYNGLPLYTFAEEGTGELTGDGFTDDFQGTHFEWSAAQASGAVNPPADSDSDSDDDTGGGYDY